MKNLLIALRDQISHVFDFYVSLKRIHITSLIVGTLVAKLFAVILLFLGSFLIYTLQHPGMLFSNYVDINGGVLLFLDLRGYHLTILTFLNLGLISHFFLSLPSRPQTLVTTLKNVSRTKWTAYIVGIILYGLLYANKEAGQYYDGSSLTGLLDFLPYSISNWLDSILWLIIYFLAITFAYLLVNQNSFSLSSLWKKRIPIFISYLTVLFLDSIFQSFVNSFDLYINQPLMYFSQWRNFYLFVSLVQFSIYLLLIPAYIAALSSKGILKEINMTAQEIDDPELLD